MEATEGKVKLINDNALRLLLLQDYGCINICIPFSVSHSYFYALSCIIAYAFIFTYYSILLLFNLRSGPWPGG